VPRLHDDEGLPSASRVHFRLGRGPQDRPGRDKRWDLKAQFLNFPAYIFACRGLSGRQPSYQAVGEMGELIDVAQRLFKCTGWVTSQVPS
jgi:hypothetical protein